MRSGDAVQCLFEFARLQGNLVRHFLSVYEPKDLERFRDVKNGTLSIGGKSWRHYRHGAGVLFMDSDDVRVNAHVAMVDHPEAMDGGRLFEYLESLGFDSVFFEEREYLIDMPEMVVMLGDMVRCGMLCEVFYRERLLFKRAL